TDDIPISTATARRHPTNWYLSVHRAVSVVGALSTAGVPAKRMGAMGFGEFHPIAPNAPGHKGNPQNRRVEIWIVSPERLLTTAATSEISE
ncbi:MAG: OmpA family protein, partial [Planctomycetes bacterium]|nr:OmpA family protein [Planctomycetota bacterium]